MNLIKYSIKDPVTVIVGVLLIAVFGLISLFRFPIQLTPNIDIPIITVTTTWADASPQEIEQEIIKRQEEKLKNVQGLKKMTSKSRRSVGEIRLEFDVGTNIDRARLDVSDMLRQVTDYPEKADEPIIKASSSDESNAIAWLILKATDKNLYVPHMYEFVDDFVLPRLRRVPGVAQVLAYGGQDREAQVLIDMPALAARGLNVSDVKNALIRENINATAGDIEQGKDEYQIRAVGQFEHLSDVANVVIAQQPGGPVYVRDIAKVVFGYKEPDYIVRERGKTVLAIPVFREVGSNVIEVMAGIRQAVKELNAGLLTQRHLKLVQVYDETDYIYSAIGLVRSNLILGSLLAILVMLLFLRAGKPTLVVAVSIPISVIGTFLALSLMGRNLNVVSLAGMAFAVGMVVDNAIVVLENIYRHRQMGKSAFQAAYDGTSEVWGAVLSSTLTTVAVFLPIVFIREEAGQLFRDIALAISAGVSLSLLVSITVIPMLSARILHSLPGSETGIIHSLTEKTSAIGATITNFILSIVSRVIGTLRYKLITILLLVGVSIVGSILLMPPASYLPIGNRNLVFAFLIMPPGYSINENIRIGKQIENFFKPYWYSDKKPIAEQLKHSQFPPIKNSFYVGFGDYAFIGVTSTQPRRARELIPLVNRAWQQIPGVWGFASQPSIFGRSVSGRGNTIDIEISGNDINQVTRSALIMFGAIASNKMLGGKVPQPQPPNFMLGGPEVRLEPDRVKLARAGANWDQISLTLAALVDGAKIGDFHDRGKKIDLVLKTKKGEIKGSPDLIQTPIYTRRAGVVPLSNLVSYITTSAQQEIDHVEERRAVTLIVDNPKGMELQRTMGIIQNQIITPLRKAGLIAPDIEVHLAGTADKLTQTLKSLSAGFILAILITYLLMSSLFGSFIHPLVIMFSVPLAAVGGFLGLRIVHMTTGQPMDVLTMLGFVILIGTVVNNAILIIHQALHFIKRDGKSMNDALIESVRTRLRPIFMSTTTTIFGMLPLVIMPGAGSELYRGLGAVIVGGLFVSTIFTLVLIPTLASFIPLRWISAVEQEE